MKVKIQPGAKIFQDYAFMIWPTCKLPAGQEEDPDMIFEAEWTGHYWICVRPGFGRSDEYGYGSIFVNAKDGVIPVEEDA